MAGKKSIMRIIWKKKNQAELLVGDGLGDTNPSVHNRPVNL
jgi:hypothetical protein